MSRARFVVTIFFLLSLGVVSSAQSDGTSSASCNLDDGRQVYVRYNPVSSKSEKAPNGKPWAPGGSAMTLFTEAPLSFGNASIPIGAYSLYPIPGKDKWSLVVNKNVAPHSAYDEKQDIVRASIETDQVSQPADSLDIAFAHVGSKCTLRIYYGKSACFADFVAK